MSQLVPEIDPDGLLEYSVVFTDRSLNHMSQAFQQVMRDISATLKQAYHAEAVAVDRLSRAATMRCRTGPSPRTAAAAHMAEPASVLPPAHPDGANLHHTRMVVGRGGGGTPSRFWLKAMRNQKGRGWG
mgnify:CR=1 FL=1